MMKRKPQCGVPADVRAQKMDVETKSRKKVRCLAETIVFSPLENMGRTRHLSITVHQINAF